MLTKFVLLSASLSEELRMITANELGCYIMQLRALESNYIGAADRGPVLVGAYAAEEARPFDNEEQFNEYFISRMPPKLPDTFRTPTRAILGADHKIVFTHGDIAPRNIMVADEGHITGILDWEYAEYYPE
jgi:hypothetical protein